MNRLILFLCLSLLACESPKDERTETIGFRVGEPPPSPGASPDTVLVLGSTAEPAPVPLLTPAPTPIVSVVKTEVITTYGEVLENIPGNVTENTIRLVWTACPADSRIMGGGCSCGESGMGALNSFQIYNAQFCMCGAWYKKMVAYATCLREKSIEAVDFTQDQALEVKRLKTVPAGASVANGLKNNTIPGPNAIPNPYPNAE